MCDVSVLFIFWVISSLVCGTLDEAVGAAVGPLRPSGVERNHVGGVLPGRRPPKSLLRYHLYTAGGR
jgi:hypothetical protein